MANEKKTYPKENEELATKVSNFYTNSREARREQEAGWDKIVEKYEGAFEISDSSKDFHINSKLLFQSHQRIVNKMKRVDRKLFADGANLNTLGIVKDTLNTVQGVGGFVDALVSDWGTFHKFVLLGDAFLWMGAGNDEMPVKFKNVNLLGVFLDPAATKMTSVSTEEAVREVLVVFEEKNEDIDKMFPDLDYIKGRLPMSESAWQKNRLRQTNQQITRTEAEFTTTEIGYYYNIKGTTLTYAIYVGAGLKLAELAEGDKYPFFDYQKEAYIPLLNFKCFPVPRGFYGKGVGHLLYDLAIVQEKLRNMALWHVEDNINPIQILTTSGGAGGFLDQMLQARELRAMNEKALIINELRMDGSNTSNGTLNSLRTDPLTAEYERMQRELTVEIKRCGIPIDDIDRPTSETATATISEETRATAFVQQIQEQNREPYSNADMYTIHILKDTVSVSSNFPIMTAATLSSGDPVNAVGKKKLPKGLQVNLGKVIDHLDFYTFWSSPQSRSGAHKSSILEKEEMDTIMPFLGALPEDVQRELIDYRLEIAGIKVDSGKKPDSAASPDAGAKNVPPLANPPQATGKKGSPKQLLDAVSKNL